MANHTHPAQMSIKRTFLGRWLSYTALPLLLGALASPCFAETIDYDGSGNLISIHGPSSGAPVILRHPQRRVAGTNQFVSFNVLLAGARPFGFQWQFNNVDIVGATNETLLLAGVGATNAGNYRVIVSNSHGTVTSLGAALELDGDGDGLPDAWEIANFGGITNQLAWADSDNDGVRNLDEFYEGTSPTNRNSYNRRLSVRAGNGQVVVDPLLPYYTNGQQVTLEAIPDAGQSFIAWTSQTYDDTFYSLTNPVVLTMSISRTNSALMGLPISAAVDNNMPWTLREASFRAGNDGWFGQTNVTHDGVDALQTFRRLAGSYLVMTNVIEKDGTVSFWWRVDTLRDNTINFSVNGTTRPGSLNGSSNWVRKIAFLPRGTNLLRWVFTDIRSNFESPQLASPLDSAWIDEVVVEPYDDPLLDRDGDGLPDLFEVRYFDSLVHNAQADTDGDGVSNLDEYLEGTNPNSNTSLLPRLFVQTQFGSVVKTPDQPKYPYGLVVALEGVPDTDNYFVKWYGDATATTNRTNSIRLNGSRTVGALFGLPLHEVVDAPALTFTRGGNAGLYGQLDVSHDGFDGASTPPLASREQSWMETAVTGPGSLTFWWRINADNSCRAIFSVNGQPAALIAGQTNWRVESIDLPAGPATLRWLYTNNFNTFSRSNAAWVDEVSWIQGESAPRILEAPVNLSVFTGSNVTFRVRAAGTPPLSYEWFQGGVSLGAPSTNATLNLGAAQSAWDGRTYTVRVTNALGATNSPPASLQVFPVPPLNDNFAQRAVLTLATPARGHNVGATTEPNEPMFGSQTVWWRWTAPSSGRYAVRASASGSEWRSLDLAVLEGSTLNTLIVRASDSDSAELTNGVYEVSLEASFQATAGTQYSVWVDAFPAGFFDLLVVPVVGPTNDHFANRAPLTGINFQAFGTTLNSTVEPNEPVQSGMVPAASVWYTWTAPVGGQVQITLVPENSFPMVSVYTGSALNALNRIVDAFPEFGETNFLTVAGFVATAGTSYQIQVGETFGNGDAFTLMLNSVNARIVSAQITSGGVSFTIEASPGATVVVEASLDLEDWDEVSTLTVSPSGTVSFADPLDPNVPGKYFRFYLQP